MLNVVNRHYKVNEWHRSLEEKRVEIQTDARDTAETGIRSLIFSDPGGYKLEFFA